MALPKQLLPGNQGDVRFTVDLSDEERRKLRLLASIHDVSMSQMVREMIHDYYTRSEMPNFNFSDQDIKENSHGSGKENR